MSLIGPNGTGKTTLIKALAGQRELDAGKLRRGHNVKLGLLSQHAEELGAPGARTVLEAAQRATGLKPNEARSLLGRFLFSGEAAEKPLDGLSGGERRRLSLAILVHSGANVLVLDEPTNHLDLESREALEAALQALPRLAAAHLPRPRAARRRRHADGRGRGRHAALVRRRLARVRARARGAQGVRAHGQALQAAEGARRPSRTGPSKNQQRRAGELEKAIEAAEAELAGARGRARRPVRLERPAHARRSRPRRHDEAKQALQALYEEWEAVAELVRGRSPRA